MVNFFIDKMGGEVVKYDTTVIPPKKIHPNKKFRPSKLTTGDTIKIKPVGGDFLPQTAIIWTEKIEFKLKQSMCDRQ